MFTVVCYDIPDNSRRTKVGKVLEGFGARVQKSVFECDLTAAQQQKLKQRLGRLIDEGEDSVRYYVLCAQCVPRIEVVSGPPVEKTQPYFLV